MSLNRNYILGKVITKDDTAFQGVRYIDKVEVIEKFGLIHEQTSSSTQASEMSGMELC